MKWRRRHGADGPVTTGPTRLVVLASGQGSNLQAVVDACASGELPATVVAVVSDRLDAGALQRAEHAGITATTVARNAGEERTDYDKRLGNTVAGYQPDFIVLAGFMRLLSMEFLKRFPQRVINLHPALPGQFPGTHAIERALQAAQRLGLNRTGVMVHYVPDEGVDNGPVIATCEVPIRVDDTIEALTERVHEAEHRLLVEALGTVVSGSRGRRERA